MSSRMGTDCCVGRWEGGGVIPSLPPHTLPLDTLSPPDTLPPGYPTPTRRDMTPGNWSELGTKDTLTPLHPPLMNRMTDTRL